MRINSVQNMLFAPKVQPKVPFRGIQTLNKDTVSFSGSKLEFQNRPNVKEGVDLGVEIYKNLDNSGGIEEVRKIVKNKVPKAEVFSMDVLKKSRNDTDQYEAFFTCELNDDFSPKYMKLYAEDQPRAKTITNRMVYAMTVGHEFTHLKQTDSGEQGRVLKEISKGDKTYADIVGAIGDAVFTIFDTNARDEFILNAFDMQDKFNTMRFGVIVPREKEISKQTLFKSEVKNEDEFRYMVQTVTNDCIVKYLRATLEHPEIHDEKVISTLVKVLEEKDGINKVAKDIKDYCAYSAKKEQEAYTTESLLARKFLNTNKSLNIDILPEYYSMLKNAF